MAEMTTCAKHSSVQTSLRCGRCDTSVCPQCMVHAPVGIRCPECGQARRLPMFEVSGLQMARAIAVALAVGVAGGVVFSLLVLLTSLPYIYYLPLFVGVGFLVGEATRLSVNRKKGSSLKLAAAGGMLAALAATVVLGAAEALFTTGLYGIIALGIAFYLAVRRF